ncbi:MAG: PEP-CTERM sorting domain-containing protein [Proteobacteria bacterium]|nr:PEP-CTERM sorting domain-containing protein [Pseudomonadota bacterium]
MKSLFKWRVAALAAAGAAVMAPAHADLTLTADGMSLGFTLSNFATVVPGNSGCCSGPFGVAMDTTGGLNTVIVSAGVGTRYTFNDMDGQTTATALTSTPSSSSTSAYATAGGLAYGGDGSGRFVQFNKDGSVNHALTGVGASPYLGMWGNPVNGHIIATSSSGLIDIDPLANGGAGSFRVINGAFGDGVSVSPDGKTAYLETGGGFTAYDIATGAVVASYSDALLSTVDGSGVIASSNSLNGDIVANNNNGTIVLIDPDAGPGGTATYTLIATGGTRGDYTSPDVTNGSLFLDTSDIVYRLSCGTGCGIGTTNGIPEPSSLALAAVALTGAAFGLRRRRSMVSTGVAAA